MLLRSLFLLLLALNLGAAAWLLFGTRPAPAVLPATDPGVPELTLMPPIGQANAIVAHAVSVGRPPAPAAPVSTVSAPLPADAASVADVCASLGPFMTKAGMRRAMQALTPHVTRIQYREVQVGRSHGFWVFLPPAQTRAAALDAARELAAKGIHDYYVVTAGDAQNTISLGLFDRETNAQARATQVRKLGFPAEVKRRVEAEPAYRIDYVVPAGDAFDWKTLLPGRNDLEDKPVDCF